MPPPPKYCGNSLTVEPTGTVHQFITRARIYIGEKEPKDMSIYKFMYDILFIQMFTVFSNNGDLNVLMSTGNDIRHLL
jgi:hypothetical protein